jgi:hypothetical protein
LYLHSNIFTGEGMSEYGFFELPKGQTYKFVEPPKPVGYWDLYAQAPQRTSIAMYHKPTDEQIKNTEQLLGWKWRDA